MKHLSYFIFTFVLLISCSNRSSNEFIPNQEISKEFAESIVNTENRLLLPEEFKAKMEQVEKYHLVDVRTPAELADNGTIEGSINIDFTNANFEEEINKLNKGIPIFIFCRSGGRSEKACALLNGYGFENVYDLKGGYQAWLEKHKKVL